MARFYPSFYGFIFAAPPVAYLADDAISMCHLGGCDEKFFPSNFGLRELRKAIQQGEVRLGTRAVVVCLLGRADVVRGRKFPAVVEEFIKVFRTYADQTRLLLGGPFPLPGDNLVLIRRLMGARHYLEERVTAEALISFSRVAERFADGMRGLNPRLVCPEGLTIRGCEILRRELHERLDELSLLP